MAEHRMVDKILNMVSEGGSKLNETLLGSIPEGELPSGSTLDTASRPLEQNPQGIVDWLLNFGRTSAKSKVRGHEEREREQESSSVQDVRSAQSENLRSLAGSRGERLNFEKIKFDLEHTLDNEGMEIKRGELEVKRGQLDQRISKETDEERRLSLTNDRDFLVAVIGEYTKRAAQESQSAVDSSVADKNRVESKLMPVDSAASNLLKLQQGGLAESQADTLDTTLPTIVPESEADVRKTDAETDKLGAETIDIPLARATADRQGDINQQMADIQGRLEASLSARRSAETLEGVQEAEREMIKIWGQWVKDTGTDITPSVFENIFSPSEIEVLTRTGITDTLDTVVNPDAGRKLGPIETRVYQGQEIRVQKDLDTGEYIEVR